MSPLCDGLTTGPVALTSPFFCPTGNWWEGARRRLVCDLTPCAASREDPARPCSALGTGERGQARGRTVPGPGPVPDSGVGCRCAEVARDLFWRGRGAARRQGVLFPD